MNIISKALSQHCAIMNFKVLGKTN